jgi:hypothetical protein
MGPLVNGFLRKRCCRREPIVPTPSQMSLNMIFVVDLYEYVHIFVLTSSKKQKENP